MIHLPQREDKIKVYAKDGSLFIKPSELFALKNVQELVRKVAQAKFTVRKKK
jgi:hypothetical protein